MTFFCYSELKKGHKFFQKGHIWPAGHRLATPGIGSSIGDSIGSSIESSVESIIGSSVGSSIGSSIGRNIGSSMEISPWNSAGNL